MNRYYILFDTTKDYGSIYHAQYLTERTNTDILGHIVAFAERNKTDITNIRVMAFDTKKQYDQSYKNWLDKVAETQRKNKIIDFDKDTELTCKCGNRADLYGFYTCLADGTYIEPELASEWNGLYKCDKCGQIYRAV